MTLAAPVGQAFPDTPLALIDLPDADSDTALLVVVSHPGDEVEYMAGRLVSAAGDDSEDRIELRVQDGVGAVVSAAPVTGPTGRRRSRHRWWPCDSSSPRPPSGGAGRSAGVPQRDCARR